MKFIDETGVVSYSVLYLWQDAETARDRNEPRPAPPERKSKPRPIKRTLHELITDTVGKITNCDLAGGMKLYSHQMKQRGYTDHEIFAYWRNVAEGVKAISNGDAPEAMRRVLSNWQDDLFLPVEAHTEANRRAGRFRGRHGLGLLKRRTPSYLDRMCAQEEGGQSSG
jgi:hypothetical protein